MYIIFHEIFLHIEDGGNKYEKDDKEATYEDGDFDNVSELNKKETMFQKRRQINLHNFKIGWNSIVITKRRK